MGERSVLSIRLSGWKLFAEGFQATADHAKIRGAGLIISIIGTNDDDPSSYQDSEDDMRGPTHEPGIFA